MTKIRSSAGIRVWPVDGQAGPAGEVSRYMIGGEMFIGLAGAHPGERVAGVIEAGQKFEHRASTGDREFAEGTILREMSNARAY